MPAVESLTGATTLERLGGYLAGPFDLSKERESVTHFFQMQTQFIHLGFDGQRTGAETYRLRLRCIPGILNGNGHDQYFCREFAEAVGGTEFATLPALRSLTYGFDYMAGIARKGPMFGIPQEPFERLQDDRGRTLAPDIAYAAYNNFVDFHALNDLFPRPLPYVRGIEQLKQIGDRIVHPGAFTEAPVSLERVVRSGSTFRNGELSLELKGVSLVDGRPCALVNYDSGEGTLKIAFLHNGGEEVLTEGGSEYTGDIHIDLATGWVRRVTLDEFVVTQTSTASQPRKVPGYTVRHILLRQIGPEEFERPIALVWAGPQSGK